MASSILRRRWCRVRIARTARIPFHVSLDDGTLRDNKNSAQIDRETLACLLTQCPRYRQILPINPPRRDASGDRSTRSPYRIRTVEIQILQCHRIEPIDALPRVALQHARCPSHSVVLQRYRSPIDGLNLPRPLKDSDPPDLPPMPNEVRR